MSNHKIESRSPWRKHLGNAFKLKQARKVRKKIEAAKWYQENKNYWPDVTDKTTP